MFNFSEPGTGIAEPHLVQALYSHLSTSGSKYAQLVSEGGGLDGWASDAGQYVESLLKFLKVIAADVIELDSKINFHDEVEPGLTKWFMLTVWKDAIQNAAGHQWIEDSWYQPPDNVSGTRLWQLRCGAYIIALSNDKAALAKYETLHKQMRAKFAGKSTVKKISADYNKLDEIARSLKQRLLEFSDAECLPGYCELEKHE